MRSNYYSVNDVSLLGMRGSDVKDNFSLMKRARMLIVVSSGCLTLKLDNKIVKLTAETYSDLDSNKRVCEVVDATEDLSGWILSVEGSAIIRVFGNRQLLDSRYVNYVECQVPVLIDRNFFEILDRWFCSFVYTMGNSQNAKQSLIIDLMLKILYMEVANYFEQNILEDIRIELPSRSASLFQKLISLIREHARTERMVTFYSDKLCVSPQYLGRIVRQATGDTVSRLITEAVIVEAKMLLSKDELSLSDVAQKMNFADQSVFTKYFHRYTGQTPLQYRNSL